MKIIPRPLYNYLKDGSIEKNVVAIWRVNSR